MRCRFRWYLFDIAHSYLDFRDVSRKMLTLPYGEGRAAGFRLDIANASRIEGEYIEEVHEEIEVTSPLGSVYKYSAVKFHMIRFQLLKQPLALRLADPPRSLRSLFRELKTVVGSMPSVPEVDVRAWLNNWLARRPDTVVNDISLADMTVGRTTRAAIRFVGPVDVRQDARRFLSGKEPIISSVAYQFNDGDLLGRCELRANCTAVIHAWRPAQIADEIWAAFLSSQVLVTPSNPKMQRIGADLIDKADDDFHR